jgi:hypothetical protein
LIYGGVDMVGEGMRIEVKKPIRGGLVFLPVVGYIL